MVGGQLAAKSMLLRYGGDHHFKTLPLHVAQLHSLNIVDAAAASHIKIIISDEEANLVAEESSVADVRGGSIICVDRKFVVEAAAWDAAAARATGALVAMQHWSHGGTSGSVTAHKLTPLLSCCHEQPPALSQACCGAPGNPCHPCRPCAG